jgi:hypothetical protein
MKITGANKYNYTAIGILLIQKDRRSPQKQGPVIEDYGLMPGQPAFLSCTQALRLS